ARRVRFARIRSEITYIRLLECADYAGSGVAGMGVVVGDYADCGRRSVRSLGVGCGLVFFFFFQAEDGIRDKLVTGVQTCALPISSAQSAPTARQPTIGDLASRKVEVHRDTMVNANVSRAMENYRRFLELQNTD